MDHVIINRAYLRCSSLDQGRRTSLSSSTSSFTHIFIRQILHQSIAFILILLSSISITQFKQYNTNPFFIQQYPTLNATTSRYTTSHRYIRNCKNSFKVSLLTHSVVCCTAFFVWFLGPPILCLRGRIDSEGTGIGIGANSAPWCWCI